MASAGRTLDDIHRIDSSNVITIPFDRRNGIAYSPVEAVVRDRHWMLEAADASTHRGLRTLEIHPFAQEDGRLLAWSVAVATASQPDPTPDSTSLVEMATEHRRQLSDEDWTRNIVEYLEEAYLSSDSPFAQTGKGGGAAEWEAGRRIIADAIPGPGTFLDACCANGLLMESMAGWAQVEPYGLDISDRLVDLARRRLPHWSDRIWVGDARTWQPPRRFDYVYVLPDITRPHLREDMIAHLLAETVGLGGRLIVGQYLSASNDDLDAVPIWDHLAAWGFGVAGSAVRLRTADPGGPRTEIAWIPA